MKSADDRLDAAIDAVAREMTEPGTPDAAAFRCRVLDGIDASAVPRKTWRSAWVLAPLAAAAAVVIAVAMYPTTVRPKPDTTDARTTVRLKPDTTDERTTVRPKPDTTDARTTVRLKPDTTDERTTVRPKPDTTDARTTVRLKPDTTDARLPARRSSTEDLQRPSALAAVAPPPLAIAPIDVAPLGAARLDSADSIQVPRLDAITPIDVTPLGLDDSQRRDE